MEKTVDNNTDINICEVNITDEMLETLSFLDFVQQIGDGRRVIKFYVDRTLSLENSLKILEKLEEIASSDGTISIYTSGRNFNELMKAIKLRKSDIHHEVHIDDNDIRNALDINNIICSLNFSRIACDCYFSDRYLVNFNSGDYINLSRFPECKFDRHRIDRMRGVIEQVWSELVPSIYSANSLSGVAKVEMILDYISKRISTTDNFRETRFRDVKEHSRRNYQVDDYAYDALGVFREGDGTYIGKTKLAALLLDNYFAQVDCRIVNGDIFPIVENAVWLVTRHGDRKYGHSLDRDVRFSDLEKLGYINGIVSLDSDHKYRSDYSYDVAGYSELDEITYFNLKSSLDSVRSTFIFPPKIIGTCIFDEEYTEDIYRNISPKSSGKFGSNSHNFSVKSASRKIFNKVHSKRMYPERLNKRNRHNIRKN